MNPVSIHPNLFKAAAAGNAEPFKNDIRRDEIESLLTAQTKNTILHINITSRKRKNVSTKFIEEILDICPSLLLKVNAKGDTPLQVAAKFGHSDIVSVLIKEAKSAQHGNEEPERGVEAARKMIRMANNEKNTALHEAVCHGNVQVVKILMKHDPDYSYSPNNFGKTPLYMAVEGRYSEMVIELLENCTSVSYEGPKGKTALHAAAMHFYFGGITTYDCARQISGLQFRNLDKAAFQKLLEKKEGLIQKRDYYGWTPIHYAAYHDQYQQMRVLLEIDQTASNIADKDRKMTALHLAAGQGHARTVETILSLSPECYELVDNRGWNFLHYAVVSFKFQDLKNLLKNPLARSLIDEGDDNGNTPLHVLAAIHRKEFFKIKVRYDTGGNNGAVNNKNVSVIDVLIYGSCELKEDVRNLSRDNGRGQYSDGIICKRALFEESQ